MNSELKYLIKPGLLLITLIVMFIVVINLGFKQIYLLYTNINDAKEMQRLLSIKVNILETVDEVLADNITFIDIALPSKGSVLYGMSQVKKLAILKNVHIINLRASAQGLEENGISKNSLNFEVEGNEEDIHTFLASFYTTLPLMNLEKVKISKLESVVTATVTVSIYSASLPEKIPATNEAIDGFTTDDIAMLEKLSQFTPPDFVDPKPSEGTVREDLFR